MIIVAEAGFVGKITCSTSMRGRRRTWVWNLSVPIRSHIWRTAWRHTPLILALKKQADWFLWVKFSHGYTVRTCFKDKRSCVTLCTYSSVLCGTEERRIPRVFLLSALGSVRDLYQGNRVESDSDRVGCWLPSALCMFMPGSTSALTHGRSQHTCFHTQTSKEKKYTHN